MFNLLQKKLVLLTLIGSISPSFTLIKTSNSNLNYKILVNYNGQAELLLSLGIHPDYFPYQFKQRSLYDYLTNVNKYLVSDDNILKDKKNFGQKLQTRLNELINKVSTFGPSLWNEDLYSGGLVNKNTQFWSSKTADYLFLEQFIVDDSSDPLFLLQTIPKHTHLAVTNFRAARDPYTIFGEDVYKYFKNKGKNGENGEKNTAEKLYGYYQNYNKIIPNNLYKSAKYIEFWNSFCEQVKNLTNKNGREPKLDLSDFFSIPKRTEPLFVLFDQDDPSDKTSQSSRDRALAEKFESLIFDEEQQGVLNAENSATKHHHYKLNYLANRGAQSTTLVSSSRTVKSPTDSICPSSNSTLVQASVPNLTQVTSTNSEFYTHFPQSFPADLKELKSYSLPQLVHHPALEHQTIKGGSPVSEGTQKELLVYLAQMAVALHSVSQSSKFDSVFNNGAGDSRKEWIQNAFQNASAIAKAYKKRLQHIREYLQSIEVVDPAFNPDQQCYKRDNSKTLALVSYPPSQLGAGNATIQTVSKYSFIYNDLGLKEALPKNFSKDRAINHHSIPDELFGLDDNGWWWNLGDFNLSDGGLNSFKEVADSVILLATEDDFNILNSGNNPKLNALKNILKSGSANNFEKSSYHLWNEGLRSPIALNLLLDVLVEKLKKQFDKNGASDSKPNSSTEASCPEIVSQPVSTDSNSTNGCSVREQTVKNGQNNAKECKYKKAMEWGDYWTQQFVQNQAKLDSTSTDINKQELGI